MAVNDEIFLGSGATLGFVPEVDFYIKKTTATGVVSSITLHSDQTHFLLIKDMYKGCTIDRYVLSGNVFTSSHTITGNTTDTISFTPATATTAADDYFVIRGYGAPCPAPSNFSKATLNADNWLGLVESATFPNIEIEMKQLNLQLGGTRNFTHQYKGIETASGGNINLVANQGHWLYYALGKCTAVTPHTDILTTVTTSGVTAFASNSADNNAFVFDDTAHIETGPIFYRTMGSKFVPPLMPSDVATPADLERLDILSTTDMATKFVTYTFSEQNTSQLPSFALEQSISKLESSDTYLTDIDSADTESHTFVRVARGNRVNTLTMTANENEEVKMTMDLNTSAVTELDIDTEMYARRGQSNVENFSNRKAAQSGHLEPFFFSDGTITIYNQELLKITNFTLTINNNIQDKRFISAVKDRGIKQGIPSQRNYEISFTALVTDDKLFRELVSSEEDVTNNITLQFDKSNGEQIKLVFENYFTSANTWTIPDDKGPITVEATVMPRGLVTDGCTVITHAALMG